MAAGLILPFVLIGALNKGFPDYLEAAAAGSGQIRASVAIAIVGSALTLFIGVTMFPVLKSHSLRAAVWFLAVCSVSCALDLAHNATVLTMLSAAERLVAAGAGDDTVYRASGLAAASLRRSVHIMQLAAIAGWMISFYFSVFRFRLTPRIVSALGIAGVISQFTGVTAMMLLGYPTIGVMAMALAPIHAAAAVYLIVKGFPERNEQADELSDQTGARK
jgi:hypothetical protein